jgi:uncharacterized membrane protein
MGAFRRARLAVAGVAVVMAAAGVAGPVAAAGTAAARPAGGGGPVDLTGVPSQALDVNDRGVVVGWYVPGPDGVRHAFRRTPSGRVVDLGPGSASAVNAAGVAVGERTGADGIPTATLWDAAGRAHDLGAGLASWASDVSDHGTVVGGGVNPDRAYVLEPGGTPEPLADPAGAYASVPAALNERGQIVGVTTDEVTGAPRPVIWEGPDRTAALVPILRDTYDVTGINERGTIAGTTLTETGYRAVVWTGRLHREAEVGTAGVDAIARDLDDGGRVVGIHAATGDAFLWDPRRGTSVLPGLAGLRDEALAVSGRGVVVGSSTVADGTTRAVRFGRTAG